MSEPKTPEEFVRVRHTEAPLDIILLEYYRPGSKSWLFVQAYNSWDQDRCDRDIHDTRDLIRAASDLAVRLDRETRERKACSRCGLWETPIRVRGEPVCTSCIGPMTITEGRIPLEKRG